MSMDKKNIFSLIVVLLLTTCSGQDNKKRDEKKHLSNGDGTNKPRTEVKVNRKYDSKGNLIHFDSTYSYFYSSKGLDSVKMGADTIFHRFRSHFKHDFPSFSGCEFNDLFFNDSLSRYDFLNPDYFTKRF